MNAFAFNDPFGSGLIKPEVVAWLNGAHVDDIESDNMTTEELLAMDSSLTALAKELNRTDLDD